MEDRHVTCSIARKWLVLKRTHELARLRKEPLDEVAAQVVKDSTTSTSRKGAQMVGSTMLTCVARQEAGVDPSPSHHDPNLDPLDVADDEHDFSDSDCEEAHALRFHDNAPFQNRHVDDFAKSAMN